MNVFVLLYVIFGVLVPFVVAPFGLVVSLRYAFFQKRRWLCLLAGGIGMGAVYLIGLPIWMIVLGFEVGVAYGSFFMPPASRRFGAVLGWLAGMVIAANMNWLLNGGDENWHKSGYLVDDFLEFGPMGGLIGAFVGLNLRLRRASK